MYRLRSFLSPFISSQPLVLSLTSPLFHLSTFSPSQSFREGPAKVATVQRSFTHRD